MKLSLALLIFSLLLQGNLSFAEDFGQMCQAEEKKVGRISLFNCGGKTLPSSITKLVEFSGSLGKSQCKKYVRSLKKKANKEEDIMVFDKDKKTVRSLKCLCQEKLKKGLCKDSASFKEKLSYLNRPYQIKAWGIFTQDLFEKSVRGGEACIQKLSKTAQMSGCLEVLDNLQKDSRNFTFGMAQKSSLIVKADNFKELLGSLKRDIKIDKGMVRSSKSGYSKTNDRDEFFKDNKLNENTFLNLSTSRYEKVLKENNLSMHLEKFKKTLTSKDPEKSLRENYKGGVNYFSLNQGLTGEALKKRVALASHPDLKWLFSGITNFSLEDRKRTQKKFLNYAALAKENEFASFKELRLLYEKKHGADCSALTKKMLQICKMDDSQNISITKELMAGENVEAFTEFISEAATVDAYKLRSIFSEIKCFQFPKEFEPVESESAKLISRSIDPKEFLDRGGVVEIEAKLDSAIDKVTGLESIAERIAEAKIRGDDPVKVEALESRFSDYLEKIELPDGALFNFPAGIDSASAVAAYKGQVYNWANKAIERRVSDIQSESGRIVSSNLSPTQKKVALERLLDEIKQLNDGDFLEEIYQEKRKISDYIQNYEDQKADWIKQYGEEAKINPKAVRSVTARSFKSAENSAAGRSNGHATSVPSSSVRAANINKTQSYIPAPPSLPFAQGSLLTRIIPKEEFQDTTVKANLLAKHKAFPIAVLDEKKQMVELYSPDGTSYKLQETLTITEAEAKGYVFPEDIKKLVAEYNKDKSKGRAPASFMDYGPKDKKLQASKKKLKRLQALADIMEKQGVPRHSRVVKLNQILDAL